MNLLSESLNDAMVEDLLSENDLRCLGAGIGALGEQDLEGVELEELAIELLVIGEALDAATVTQYKAHRAKGMKPASALKHAKVATGTSKEAEAKRSEVTSKFKSLHTLDKRPNKKLPPGEKMVFGRVVKTAA